jgi:prepilin-type processing-associated H-X9-DG protein
MVMYFRQTRAPEGWYDYGITAQPMPMGWKLADIQKPTEVPILGDTRSYASSAVYGHVYKQNKHLDAGNPNVTVPTDNYAAHLRHNLKANIMFGDMHVSGQSYDQLVYDTTKNPIGFARAQISLNMSTEP